jgi:peroxiredoxin
MRSLLCVLLLLVPAFCLAAGDAGPADEPLLGTRPPEWRLTDWLNSGPLTLKDLRGKVVLIRWWTAPGCPFCAATAPALNEFHGLYKDKGLVVLGVYHHKSSAALHEGHVKRWADSFRFRFPVATDPDWQTLRRWWLTDGKRRWTSVSFLLDRRGVIRHIHPGGSYVRGGKDYDMLKARIEELLRQD